MHLAETSFPDAGFTQRTLSLNGLYLACYNLVNILSREVKSYYFYFLIRDYTNDEASCRFA